MIFNIGKKSILLVDDDPSISETAMLILETWGLKVITANNGNDAVDFAKKNKPDLVILDLNLPGINGYDVCRILKKTPETKNTPIIMLTGYGKTGEVEKGFEIGADEYIIKPVDWDRFKPKIAKLLKINIP